jgi:small-conductance mechanosensitive channel
MIIIMTMELIELQSSPLFKEAKDHQYASIHPAILIVAMFLLMPVFHPLFMHWRNQSGLFKPQPYAVWFSISVTVLGVVLAVTMAFFYLGIAMTALSPS